MARFQKSASDNQANQSADVAQPKIKKKKKHGIGWILGEIFGLILLIALIAGGSIVTKKIVLPVIEMYREAEEAVAQSTPETFKNGQPSVLYDAQGNQIKKMKGEKEVKYLTYDELPEAAKLAIISIEDKNFASHRGIDLIGIARSVVSLIKNRGQITMGGSTITQQLSRNIFLNFDETYSRKLKEVFIALALEKKYTKEQILEFYLNNVYFANGYYGIEAAAQAYFRKSSNELTIAQIAYLCAIPNSPGKYDPYKDADATMKRQRKILDHMYQDGYLNKEQYLTSCKQDIAIYPKQQTTTNDYVQTYMLRCAVEALMEAQGFNFRTQFDSKKDKEKYDEQYDEVYNACRQSLYNNGYQIHTSIDMQMQAQLQSSISQELGSYFLEKTDDGIYQVQGAAVCIDNITGKVVAIVGGREQDQEGYGLNRAYQSFRQPGSAIKPVLVYAPAFDEGYNPDSIVDDSPMEGENAVKNAGDYDYDGNISIRRAVMKSSNVATYRLYQTLGPDKCMKYLERMNFRGLQPDDYKYPTTCLGGFTTGVTPLEMAASYATLANDGTYRKPTCITKITDSEGNVVVGGEPASRSVYSSNSAKMMTSAMISTVEDGGTASVCKLDQNMPAACKTGTTTNCVDGWLCGYTPYYTTAVWVGKDIYEEVEELKGNTYPARIWTNFMNQIHVSVKRDEGLESEFGNYMDTGISKDYQQYVQPADDENDQDYQEEDVYYEENNDDDNSQNYDDNSGDGDGGAEGDDYNEQGDEQYNDGGGEENFEGEYIEE